MITRNVQDVRIMDAMDVDQFGDIHRWLQEEIEWGCHPSDIEVELREQIECALSVADGKGISQESECIAADFFDQTVRFTFKPYPKTVTLFDKMRDTWLDFVIFHAEEEREECEGGQQD